jgi:hypothetical protein
MGNLPDIYRAQGMALSRQEEKALRRQFGAGAQELLAVDHAQLVERAKMRALAVVAEDAMDEVIYLGNEVARCAEQNPLAAPLAADFAAKAQRELVHRLKRTNERLG